MEPLALGRRTPVCIGPSERTVPTAAAAAAVRVGYVCLLAHRTGVAELIAFDRTFW